jgi:hypothetical protein
MALDLSPLTLGSSTDVLQSTSSDDVREAVTALAAQAQRSLTIFSRQLDHKLYNQQALCDAILKLATSSRYAMVRIIVQDSTAVIKQGSRLVELSHRISSRLQIRKPPIEYKDNTEEFVIADDSGLVHRRQADRYAGEVCFHASLKCRQLLKYFDDCWEKSGADPDLRRLFL